MAQPPSPTKTATNPRIAKLIELETRGVIKPEHEEELNVYRAQGLAPSAPKSSLTEAQGKATGFYGRALEADENFTKTHSATEPRGLLAQTAANIAPGLANTLSSPDRQMSEQAKRNFILASLRYESGASINADEFEKQDRAFFPQPGDGPEVIAQKAKDRQVVIQGLKEGAGPGATGMQSAAPPADPNAPSVGKTVTTPILEAGSANIIGAPSTGQRMTVDIGGGQYTVQSPEFRAGLTELMDRPGVTADEIRQYWDRNAKGGDVAPATPEAAQVAPPPAVERGKNGFTDRLDAGIRGAADTATLGFADELAAGGRTLFGDKTMAENLAAERGVDDYDQQNHFGYRLAGQLAGGTVLPMGDATDAVSLAKAGGGYGAAYGFGSTNGSLKDRFVGAGIGGVTGAAGGYGLGKLSELYQGRGPLPPGAPPTGNAVADAATRRNIPIIAADVAPGARGANALLESIPFAGGVVRRRMDAGNEAIESQVADLAGGVAPGDRTAVGEDVQTGAKNWIKKSGAIKDALYGRAQDLAGDTQIVPKGAIEAIDTHLADLQRIPGSNAHKIDVLQTMRGDMVDAAGNPKPMDIDSLRAIRTNVREQMDAKNIRSNDLDRRLGDIKSAITGDVSESLAGNPRALSAYGRADAFAADRATRIDNVLSHVIGPKNDNISGEEVMAKIESMASPGRGKSEKLGVLMSSLRPDEREQVAAHIANTLGRADPDSDFSSGLLLRQVRKLSQRARVQIFGKNGAEALSDLATVAEARAATISKLNNTGSGRVSNYLQVMKGLVGLGGGAGVGAAAGIGAPAGAAITAAGLVGANISARVLTNPAVARALAQGLRATTKQAAQNTVTRLGNIATSNPAIRTEMLSIQRRLSQAVNDNLPAAGRAAASPDEGPGNEQ